MVQPSFQYIYSCNSSASCGCSSNSASVTRVVGGETAGSSTWSWAVSISINSNSLCGGAIISSSWVISAAHCFTSVTSASQVTVFAGSNTKYGGQSSVALSVIVHPDYISSSHQNDIALIQLSTPFTISGLIRSICIPSVNAATLAAGEWPSPNTYVVAVGYGRLYENGATSNSLQQVTVQTIASTTSTCNNVIYNAQNQFCAGISGGGKDTCSGDSGGPLMMFTTSNQWVLVGLTSYGVGCARPNYPGVYTRVAAYQSWITSTTGDSYTNPSSSISANINPYTSTSPSTSTSTTNASGPIKVSLISHLSFFLSTVFVIFYSA